MCRKNGPCVVLIVFCLSFCLGRVSPDETDGSEKHLPPEPPNLTEQTTYEETQVPEQNITLKKNQTSTLSPPLLHYPSIDDSTSTNTPSDVPQSLSFTQTSTNIFQETDSPLGIVDLLTASLTANGDHILVQKCCQPYQVLKLGQYNSECVDAEEVFEIDVFWANKTHYWNYTKSTDTNVIVIPRNPCTERKYFLDPEQDANDTFHLLHNSSLYFPYTMDMLGVDDYCVDIIETPSNLLTTAVICTSTPKAEVFHYLFGTGLIISVCSLVSLAVYSMKRNDIDEDHKKCLAFFSGTMAISFFFIAISVFFGSSLPSILNILIAYIVYYLKLKYFIWLTVLCYDTYRCVKNAEDDGMNRVSFLNRYLCAAFLTPAIFVLINLIDKYNPALPNLYLEFSYSSSFVWALLLFYVPTCITGIINMIIMCSIVLPQGKMKDFQQFIKYMQSENWRPTPAPENIGQLKNMYRRTCILCFLVLLFLILDFVIFLLPSGGQQQVHFMFRNVVYCLQGLFISCVFIKKEWYCKKRPQTNLNPTETELQVLTNGGPAV